MHVTRLMIIFLLCSPAIYAMELTTTRITSDQFDDILTTSICSRLYRFERNALRYTCKKCLNIILSQDELNEEYELSFREKSPQIIHWKSLGGLLPHQEFAEAVKNKKELLARWLIEKEKVSVWKAYCCNIEEAVETSTVQEILPVIEWLLDRRKPVTHQGEFLSGYHFANNLTDKYSEVQKIIDIFEKYQREKLQKIAQIAAQARQRSAYFGGSGPWHARGDYV